LAHTYFRRLWAAIAISGVDDSNGKLIGLLALGDAVFNLRVRDALIEWDHQRRAEALVNMMDACFGALPSI